MSEAERQRRLLHAQIEQAQLDGDEEFVASLSARIWASAKDEAAGYSSFEVRCRGLAAASPAESNPRRDHTILIRTIRNLRTVQNTRKKTRPMAKAKKKQPELAGMERPTIEALDSLCAEHLEAQSALADAKDHASDAKAALKACMEEHKKQLEQDADDNHIYVYQDGDERTNVVLYHEEGIRCRKEKKAKLELVEDGDID